MFSGWVDYRSPFGDVSGGPPSVLDKFPPDTGRQIALAVVDSITAPRDGSSSQPQILSSEDDVDWAMNVIAFGLRLPLEHEETIRKCIVLYQDWLNVLISTSTSAPLCVRSKPEAYARRIVDQFEGIFMLRNDSDGSKTLIHIRLTMLVLGIIQRLAFTGNLSQTTWNTILHSLVRICDRLLSPPCGLYGTLAERIGQALIEALYHVWIKACQRHFPAPALWKTLQEAVMTWRHQRPVVDQWTRVCEVLTRGVVRHLYGPSHGDDVSLKAVFEDGMATQPKVALPPDALVQCWYRFLLILGNPVELSRPKIIGKMPAFLQAAIDSGDPEQLTQHTCLQRLPTIFLLAQRGVASLVDLFLELSVQPCQLSRDNIVDDDDPQGSFATSPTCAPSESLLHAAPAAAKSSFLPASLFSTVNQSGAPRPALPKRSTLLHLFGEWLFQASLPSPDDLRHLNRLISSSSQHVARNDESGAPLAAFEAGRAEALACLCRLFCSSCCDEQFLPVYLARFYYVLQQGLLYIPSYHRGDVISNLLIYSSEIFCSDLAGAFCLMPGYLSALDLVLPHSQVPFSCNVNMQGLRRSSTLILMSLLCVPVHFNDLTVSDISQASGGTDPAEAVHRTASQADSLVSPITQTGTIRFSDMRSTVTNLVFSALRCEKSPAIIQMLLGSVMVMVQDAAAVEEVTRKENLDGSFGIGGATRDISSIGSEPGRGFSSGIQQPVAFDAAAMCVRACRDVTQRFLRVEPGNNNVHVILSVLELMSGLASLNLPGVDGSEWRYIVRWLCDFINTLVCQPPRAHSRDLHSMIVAAYHCLLAWTTCNHRLLFEQEPLHAVLDVCELGLTGSKSVSKSRDDEESTKNLRGEKEFRPVSRRVLEAAEMVLYSILEHLGAFPPPMGPGSVSSMLDEASLLSAAKQNHRNVQPFRYYAADSTTLLGVLPCPVQSGCELPTLTIILRGPSGRHTWTMQLRQVPCHAQAQLTQQLAPVPRPEPHLDPAPEIAPPRQPWPDVVKAMPVTEADTSIPSLQDTLNKETEALHLRVQVLVEKQSKLERDFVEHLPSSKYNTKPQEMKPPSVRQSFQTARLLLSHLGLVTPESLTSSLSKNCERTDSFALLDSEKSSFQVQLQNLDAVPTRHTDTVYVFYVRPGQSNVNDILLNRNLLGPQKPEFSEFLNALGWPVSLAAHPGFKGTASPLHSPTASGQAPMPYYADNNTEVLFVVPSLQKRAAEVVAKRQEQNAATDGSDATSVSSKNDALDVSSNEVGVSSSTSSSSVSVTPLTSVQRALVTPIAWQLDVSIVVVWLVRFEDWTSFPVSEVAELTTPLQSSSQHPVHIVFVHPLNTGLYRIKRVAVPSHGVTAGPLLSDMVVSRRSLGSLVRQTVINMAKRRRILSDNYSPPHALRKRRVEELCKGHIVKQSVPDFYSDLFRTQSGPQ